MGNSASVSREEFNAMRQEEENLRNRLRELEERLNQPPQVAQHRNPGDQEVGYIFTLFYVVYHNLNDRRIELNSFEISRSLALSNLFTFLQRLNHLGVNMKYHGISCHAVYLPPSSPPFWRPSLFRHAVLQRV